MQKFVTKIMILSKTSTAYHIKNSEKILEVVLQRKQNRKTMDERRKKILAFGDSIIKGVISEENGNGIKYRIPENSITDICERKLGVDVGNFGKFGCIITTREKIIDKNIDKISENDTVLIEYGGNDSDKPWSEIADNPNGEHYARTPLPIFAETYHRIVRKLKAIGSNIYMLTLPPIDTDAYFRHFTKGMNEKQVGNIMSWLYGNKEVINLWHEMYNQEIIKVAYTENVGLIDIYQPFIGSRNYRSFFCCDGIHPNQKGQEVIARQIEMKLTKSIT